MTILHRPFIDKPELDDWEEIDVRCLTINFNKKNKNNNR